MKKSCVFWQSGLARPVPLCHKSVIKWDGMDWSTIKSWVEYLNLLHFLVGWRVGSSRRKNTINGLLVGGLAGWPIKNIQLLNK